MHTVAKHKKKYIIARILSDSMRPAINRGDLVLIKKEPFETIHVGDLIGFIYHRGIPLVHRVARKSGNTIHTIADAGRRPDAPITQANVIGKVIMKKRRNLWRPHGQTRYAKFIGWLIARSSSIIVTHPHVIFYRFCRKVLTLVARYL